MVFLLPCSAVPHVQKGLNKESASPETPGSTHSLPAPAHTFIAASQSPGALGAGGKGASEDVSGTPGDQVRISRAGHGEKPLCQFPFLVYQMCGGHTHFFNPRNLRLAAQN